MINVFSHSLTTTFSKYSFKEVKYFRNESVFIVLEKFCALLPL